MNLSSEPSGRAGRPSSAAHLALVAATALATLALARPARACSVCGCGDPLLTSSDPAALSGQLRLQLDSEYLSMRAGSEDEPGAHDVLTQWTHRFNVAYRPMERMTLSATVPVVQKTLRSDASGELRTLSDAAGLGDVEVSARFAAWRAVAIGAARVQELAFSGGAALPTGDNGVRRDGARIDEHGQPGTGAWGPFAGVHFRFEQHDFTTFASLSGRVRTRNARGYTYGAAALWSVHGQFFVRRRLVVDLGVDGRAAAADRDDAGAVPHTGGTVLSLAPGVYVNAAGKAWLFLRGQVPLLQRLRGDQDVRPSLNAGLQLQLR